MLKMYKDEADSFFAGKDLKEVEELVGAPPGVLTKADQRVS